MYHREMKAEFCNQLYRTVFLWLQFDTQCICNILMWMSQIPDSTCLKLTLFPLLCNSPFNTNLLLFQNLQVTDNMDFSLTHLPPFFHLLVLPINHGVIFICMWVCIFVYMYMGTQVYVQVHEHECACRGQKSTSGMFLDHAPLFYWGRLSEPRACRFHLVQPVCPADWCVSLSYWGERQLPCPMALRWMRIQFPLLI